MDAANSGNSNYLSNTKNFNIHICIPAEFIAFFLQYSSAELLSVRDLRRNYFLKEFYETIFFKSSTELLSVRDDRNYFLKEYYGTIFWKSPT